MEVAAGQLLACTFASPPAARESGLRTFARTLRHGVVALAALAMVLAPAGAVRAGTAPAPVASPEPQASPAASPAESRPASPAASPAPGTGAPAAASSAKTLRVGTSGDYAPFSFMPAPEVLDGFDVAVAKQFASDRGYALELVRFRWPELGRDLASGSFDVAMGGVTVKAERSLAGRFSVPVAATHAVAITWKGSGAVTAADLDRGSRRIAVNAGGHLETVARRMFDRAQIVAIADNDAVRMALLDRAFDAVVTDSFEEKIWTAGERDVVRIGPLSDDRKAYLLPADRGALAAELDQWLLEREKDGTLARLRAQYFAIPAEPSKQPATGAPAAVAGAPIASASPLAALAACVLERQALMPMVYDAKRRDRKPIEDREQEVAVLDAAVRATQAAASMASKTPPPEAAVRKVFEALFAMGKDVQQGMADDEARYVLPNKEAAAAGAPSPPGAVTTHTIEQLPPATTGRRVYDLATQLRPAIARITEKLARILVAIDTPVRLADARKSLDPVVALGVRSQRADVLAAAIVEASARNP